MARRPAKKTRGGFVMLMRGLETLELLRDGDAFLLLSQIALRARRTDAGINPHRLAPGEAMIGDYRSCGLSERRARTAKDKLARWGLATFRATNRGTIATLCNSAIYDVNVEPRDEQPDRPETDQRRTRDEPRDEQETTNKNEKKEEDKKEEVEEGVGYPVGPHTTDKQVFQRIVALWNSLPGKRNVVNTRPLVKAAWNTFQALCGSLLTEFEQYGTQYSPEYVRQYIEETITNYGEAWEEYPTRDRDWGLTTFLQGGIDRADNGFDKYTPGMYCLDAFGIAATEPDREIGVEYDD